MRRDAAFWYNLVGKQDGETANPHATQTAEPEALKGSIMEAIYFVGDNVVRSFFFFFFAMFRQPYLVNLSKQFLDSSDATSRTRLLAVLVLKHGSHNDVSAPLYYYASNVLLFDGNHFSPDYHSHQFGVRCNIRLSLCHFSCLRSI